MHTSRPTVAIVGAFAAHPDLPRSPPSLTASRWSDLERLLDPAALPTDAVVCAAVLLLHRAGLVRAVLAQTVDDLPADVDVVALPGPLLIETLTSFMALAPPRPVLVIDGPDSSAVPAPAPPAPSLAVRHVRGRGLVSLPGRLRPLPASGTTLALPLLLGAPTLLPLCELIVPALPPDQLGPGFVDLVLLRPPKSGPRVALAPGTPRLLSPPPLDDDTTGSQPSSQESGPESQLSPSGAAPDPRPSVSAPDPRRSDPAIARLEASLGALTQRFAHRLERGPAALATLRREASRLLQAERAGGAITGFALSVELAEDQDGADAFIIEAAVGLPRRVGKVILRVVQR